MCGKRLSHLEGCALYLLGRLYQGWIAPEVKDSFDSSSSRVRGTTVAAASINSSPSFELRNMEQAFEYLCKSLRPKYLSDDNEEVCCCSVAAVMIHLSMHPSIHTSIHASIHASISIHPCGVSDDNACC